MIITRLLGLGRKQSQNLFWGGEVPSHACGHGELTQLPGISGISALCTPVGGGSTLTPYSWSFVPRVSFSGRLRARFDSASNSSFAYLPDELALLYLK